jgi:hypothetical protein
MIEYTPPHPGRDDPYCWLCGGYGCDNPQRSPGATYAWSAERVTPPVLTDDEPWPWLNGPAVAWWYSTPVADAA